MQRLLARRDDCGSKREEWSDFRATSDQSVLFARMICRIVPYVLPRVFQLKTGFALLWAQSLCPLQGSFDNAWLLKEIEERMFFQEAR